MEVDNNELLRRIGMVLRVISCKLNRLIEIGERVEGQVRLPSEEESKTVAEVLMNDACIPSDAVADEPPKKWRILEPGEAVQEGDWVNALCNKPDEDPPRGGWLPIRASLTAGKGRKALDAVGLYVARPVVDEPAKEAVEHPAGPKPDPGEGYRILGKDPPEDLRDGDELLHRRLGGWHQSLHARWGYKMQDTDCWYRRKIEVATEPPKPAWEPQVGDLVKVTRPEDWKEWREPLWQEEMHIYNGKFLRVRGAFETSVGHRVTLHGCDWFFHLDWLSPATTSQPLKIPPSLATVSGSGVRESQPYLEDEYRKPLLPGDFDKPCDFSSDGIEWRNGYLRGYVHSKWRDTYGVCWPCCRIKKDA
jgi:hypothetical protein